MGEQSIIEQSYRTALREYQSQRIEAAKELLDRILLLQPDHSEAIHLLGMIAHGERQFDQALEMLRHAIEIKGDDATYYASLGLVLADRGEFTSAIDSYLTAIRLDPEYADAYFNLGIAYRCCNQIDDSIDAYQKALQIRPSFPQALNNYAHVLRQSGRLEEAAEICRRTLELQPDHIESRNNLGVILKDLGRLDEAIDCLEKAISIDPQSPALRSNRLYSLYYRQADDAQHIYNEHVRWAAEVAVPLHSASPLHSNDPSPDRKLRVGYVSPDFREHCQSLFTVPLFSTHNHEQFEIYGYSNSSDADDVTAKLKSHADHWRDIAGVSDAQVADMVVADEIDILVDLTLHMGRNRLLLFARKPAPVQVTWLGYPGTTGLSTIDYRLTDPYLDPPGEHDAFYSEHSYRLPDTFWCYAPQAEIEVSDLPADRNGFITFGCLNNFCKVNDGVLKLWRQVLLAVPESQLVLLAPRGAARDRILESLNVRSDRISFLDFQRRKDYLQTYHKVDICLDTFAYNGHTTSLDAIWMGVPVVSLCGRTAVSRAGWSQASNLGLTELVAHDTHAFVEIARRLAADRGYLRTLRASLRAKMISSPLMDAPRFARNIEQAYRTMWQNWVRNSAMKCATIKQ